jgi:hypothetical protein
VSDLAVWCRGLGPTHTRAACRKLHAVRAGPAVERLIACATTRCLSGEMFWDAPSCRTLTRAKSRLGSRVTRMLDQTLQCPLASIGSIAAPNVKEAAHTRAASPMEAY